MDGDFRSDVCKSILDECDVVITNPPFSLFREFINLLMTKNKKFLIIGSQNAFTYKDVFPLIKEHKIWIGYNQRIKEFIQPDGSIKKFGNICWFTNLIVNSSNELKLTKTYKPEDYPKYDNLDGIEVNRVANIPKDYYGVMGVPITFIYKHDPNQFEIVGSKNGDDGKPLQYGGKVPYYRVLIKRKEG